LLSKDGERHIVHCKHWRNAKVGVSVVREMFGVLKASSAKTVYVVSSGNFTKEALAFAANLPITLINGDELLKLSKMSLNSKLKNQLLRFYFSLISNISTTTIFHLHFE
jgi:HJR/Mrr/RecB family endonuclease